MILVLAFIQLLKESFGQCFVTVCGIQRDEIMLVIWLELYKTFAFIPASTFQIFTFSSVLSGNGAFLYGGRGPSIQVVIHYLVLPGSSCVCGAVASASPPRMDA